LLFESTPKLRNVKSIISYTVPGRQGRQKIIPQKNAEEINKFIKYFVEINKNEVNKNCRQKNKGKRVAASKIQC
jgi:hypothetical protein